MTLASVINNLSSDDVYLSMIKQLTFTSTRSDSDIFVHNLITTHSLNHKYLTIGSLNLKSSIHNLLEFLKSEKFQLVVKSLKTGLDNGGKSFTVSLDSNSFVNIVNNSLNINTFNVWASALEFGDTSYYYGSLAEVLASLLNITVGTLCIVNNRLHLDKTMINYYDSIKDSKSIFYSLIPLVVNTQDELTLNLNNIGNPNFSFSNQSWYNINYTLAGLQLIEQKYYTDAQLVVNNLNIGTFERYYLSEML